VTEIAATPRIASPAFGLARLAALPLERMSELGLSYTELLRATGLDARQLEDPDARIPLAAVARLWEAITAQTTDPTIGLRLGVECHVRDLGLVGVVMAYSPTVAAALERLARYGRIVSDALVVELVRDAEATWVRIDTQPPLRALRPAVDARLAVLIGILREITGAPLAPLAVQLTYRRPEDVKAYERFFRAPLEFGALATAFLLDRKDLERPVALSDPTVTGYLDQLAADTLARLGAEQSMTDRVRRRLWSELSEGVPGVERVARELGMSARTLQRQLRGERTTFAAVLRGLRQELARPLLRDGRLAVSEVAFLLGYADPSAFQRAFRAWHGTSPRAFRRAGA
jgi:AraC-like DNA-binding protein